MVNKAPPLRCKNFYPRTIRYGRLVLVFSTIIKFYDDTEVDANQVDFELYDLERGNMSRNLPSLSVHRNRDGVSDGHIFSYELCDTETGSSVAFTGNYEPSRAFYFTIRGFGLIDDTQTFVVRTDMGHAFKLDLQSPTAAWELYTDGWIMGDHDSPFFVIGEQCVDPFGAYNLKIQDLDTKFELWRTNVAAIEQRAFRLDDDYNDFVEEKRRSMFKSKGGDPHILKRVNEIDRRVRFPLSSFDGSLAFESGVDFTLIDNYAITVQIGMDPSTNYPHMVIDLFNVDFLKFPKLDFSSVLEDQQYELLKHGWVKRLKTFKFVVNEECIPIHLRDVFPVGVNLSSRCNVRSGQEYKKKQDIDPYYFDKSCLVIQWSCDNPNSLSGGKPVLYYKDHDIIPPLPVGFHRYVLENINGDTLDGGVQEREVMEFDTATEVRALVKGQFLSMRAHAEGFGMPSPKTYIATGGARLPWELLLRAAHGWLCNKKGSFVSTVAQLRTRGGCWR
ncbi:xylulose 2 [Perilla frutescens var. frutescens]|nr:xylulose 2 [Perilla frutescens var. frutescens]